MNHENLEQAASIYLQKFERTDAYSPRHMERAFIAGGSWREKQAASGFDEWLGERLKEMKTESEGRFLFSMGECLEEAWQASALHSGKLLAEKDAEIEKAKEIIKYLCKTGIDYHIAEKIKALLGEE